MSDGTEVVERKKPGPPLIVLDPDRIYEFAKVGCRWYEIADELGVSERTIRRARARDYRLDLAYKKGAGIMRRSLRAKQYEMAMGGHPTMLIWLGKQELGQTDKTDTRSLHLHANVDRADLSGVDLEELRERLALLKELRENQGDDEDDDAQAIDIAPE